MYIKMSYLNLIQRLALALLISQLMTLAVANKRVKRIIGGRQAKAPPPDDPVVFTRAFNRDARVEGFRNARTGIYSFLGMRYAEPPVGVNRYARPIYKRMAGDINATRHGPPCMQPDPYNPNRIIGDEDCLLLNIYTPRMPDESTGLPVYFWIHPGGFRYGSAAQYDATPMAQSGVIVVAAQYRLGTMGVLGHGTKEFDGNSAMIDMACALRWVTDYIQYFGGDPKQVKAIGHGSGATSAMYLTMSRAGRSGGDVNGAVAMSGTALTQYATDKNPVQTVQEIADINGCPTTNETVLVECMRAKPAEEIIMNDSKVQMERLAGQAMVQSLAGGTGFQPHVEGKDDLRGLPGIITEEPEQMLRNAKTSPVPLLTGVTKHETGSAVTTDSIQSLFGSAENLLGQMNDAVKQLSGLLRIDQLTGNILKPNLPGLTNALTPTLQDLLRVPANLDPTQILSKVIDTTTNVLFNLPAVMTTQVWSQLAPAFMYSFEYNGTKSKGINFLRGLAIVGETENANPELVAHGDELGYMFDANDIFGNPLPETRLVDESDLKVRKNFIGMLVQFAKGVKADGKDGGGLFKTVTGKGVPFIKLDSKVESANDFHFCELSVLGAPLSPLATTSCEGMSGLLGGLGGAVSGLTGNLNNVGLGKVGGLLGATSPTQPQTPNRRSGGLLGLGK